MVLINLITSENLFVNVCCNSRISFSNLFNCSICLFVIGLRILPFSSKILQKLFDFNSLYICLARSVFGDILPLILLLLLYSFLLLLLL